MRVPFSLLFNKNRVIFLFLIFFFAFANQLTAEHACEKSNDIEQFPKLQVFKCWYSALVFIRKVAKDHKVIVVTDFDGTLQKEAKRDKKTGIKPKIMREITQPGLENVINEIAIITEGRTFVVTSRSNADKNRQSIERFFKKFNIQLEPKHVYFSTSPLSENIAPVVMHGAKRVKLTIDDFSSVPDKFGDPLHKSNIVNELSQGVIGSDASSSYALIVIDNDSRTIRELLSQAGKKPGSGKDYLIPEENIHILKYLENDRCQEPLS